MVPPLQPIISGTGSASDLQATELLDVNTKPVKFARFTNAKSRYRQYLAVELIDLEISEKTNRNCPARHNSGMRAAID